MARFEADWQVIMRNISMVLFTMLLVLVIVSAKTRIKTEAYDSETDHEADPFSSYLVKAMDFLWKPGPSGYHQHVWPVSSNSSHPICIIYIYML